MITLKTLHKASAQEVFDQVARHLLTQNKQSRDTMACLYRSPTGLKCAAGCLIGDDEFDLEYNSSTWPDLVSDGVAPDTHADLIHELQHLHDYGEPELWAQRLIVLAYRNNLNHDVVLALRPNHTQ